MDTEKNVILVGMFLNMTEYLLYPFTHNFNYFSFSFRPNARAPADMLYTLCK